MARTILEIAQEAAKRDATAPAPVALFSTGNKIATILATAAQDTMREYLQKIDWQGASELTSTWVFALIPGRYAYPLPPDYLRMIPNTENRGGWPLGLIGPASPQSWAAWIYGGASAPVQMGWRIRNGAIWFDPTPASNELIAIEYVSRYPVVSEIRVGDYDDTQRPPVCIAPFVPRDGYLTLPEDFDITGETEGQGVYDGPPGYDVAVYGKDTWEVLKRISRHSGIAPLPQVRRPYFEADTDKPAFDDDHLLSLGMTYRLRRSLGKDYAEIAAEYEAEMEIKAATDAGGARAFRIGGNGDFCDTAPLGGGRWLIS
ncbi:MAG: hypothetical protein IPM06_21025 [Rhizobiales bacterium]|nr:hypothetical protein [Hyphomicrobiales bacterium]